MSEKQSLLLLSLRFPILLVLLLAESRHDRSLDRVVTHLPAVLRGDLGLVLAELAGHGERDFVVLELAVLDLQVAPLATGDYAGGFAVLDFQFQGLFDFVLAELGFPLPGASRVGRDCDSDHTQHPKQERDACELVHRTTSAARGQRERFSVPKRKPLAAAMLYWPSTNRQANNSSLSLLPTVHPD